MKHTKLITLILLTFFFITQLVGLTLISQEVQPTQEIQDNQSTVHINSSVMTEIPANIFDWKAILYLGFGIAFGTMLILVFRKFKFGGKLWKVWYFLAVYVAINFSLKIAFFHLNIQEYVAIILASVMSLVLAFFKIRKENFWVHNVTEILMYSGIGTFIVLLFNNNLLFVSIVLVLISIYDMIAVWKSKHMIKLATFTAKENLFPGFSMYYKTKGNKTNLVLTPPKKEKAKEKEEKTYAQDEKKEVAKKTAEVKAKKVAQKPKSGPNHALLGGGDVIFPMLFTGVILGWLFNKGFTRMQSFGLSMIVIVFATLSLYLLFRYSKKEKFYPAMPFLSAGCFTGLGVLWIVLMLI